MDRIENIIDKIRDKINATRKQYLLMQNKKNRDKICACLDTIWDVQVSIREYDKLADDKDSLYLPIYWLLQWLYLETDAVGHLHEIICGNIIKFQSEYPKVQEIRNLRNDIIWHPISRRDKKTKLELDSFHVIGRYSISKKWFTVINYRAHDQDTIKHIDIYDIIEKQQLGIEHILTKVLNTLIEEEINHKKTFEGKNISDLIHSIFDYHISKLYEWIERDYIISKISIESIKETYENIKIAIIKRYETYSFYEHNINKIWYIIDNLLKIFNYEIDKNKKDLEIYIDVLKMEFKELKNILKEIDDDFTVEK